MMIQLKNRTTGQFSEVNEIDIHWYNGHEDYEVINERKTEETSPFFQEQGVAGDPGKSLVESKNADEGSAQRDEKEARPVLKKRGRPKK